MRRISNRDAKVNVSYESWSMSYLNDGNYYIYKNGKEVAHGKYDALIADSYNDQMTKEDRQENLERDLKSWVEKAINGKVTD